MAERTEIAWCDSTFNAWIGCTKVSPGCANCYAERDFDHRKHVAVWGPGHPRHKTSPANWRKPLSWDRKRAWEERDAEACGRDPGPPHLVFGGSLCDWLDDEVPVEWLAELLDLIRRTPHLVWLMLSKRPELFRSRLEAVLRLLHGPCDLDTAMLVVWVRNMLDGWAGVSYCAAGRENYAIGTTLENQEWADRRIPLLRAIPASRRFVSAEPLLGPVNLHSQHIKIETWRVGESFDGPAPLDGIHWVICGGESGPHARPMHPDWARSLRDQCAAAKVPFMFKQWGEYRPWEPRFPADVVYLKNDGTTHSEPILAGASGVPIVRTGAKAAGHLLDGREHNEFPEVRRD